MAILPKHPPVKVRTVRDPLPTDKEYVIKEGAPQHYISGYGLVGPGDHVTLGDAVKPGKWLEPVTAADPPAKSK